MSHFAGTSSFYAEFRPGYPDALFDSLTERSGANAGSSAVLELGCGPGTATMALARRARSVIAVDADAEMLREGRRVAAEAGVENIEWISSPAEDVVYPEQSFDLIVIASAFHWMDRPLVAAQSASMLGADGLLALLGNPTPLMQIRDGSEVGAAIGRVQDRWFGDDYYVLDVEELARPEVVLQQNGFSEVSVSYLAQTQDWTVDRFLGFLRSTSSRPDQRLGPDFAEFANEIGDAIRSVEPSGVWTLDIPIEVIVGRP